MSENKPVVTIVGLGLIGASIGLALREAGAASMLVGHDKDSAAAHRAQKAGAVDRTDWNLISACERADLIILAIPLDGLRDTLQAIGPHVRPNQVVVDTAALKKPVLDWADELLPADGQFVGLNPVLRGVPAGEGGTASARADLFRDSLVCVLPSLRASAEAVQLALGLIAVLGAKPLFYDAVEHDSLMAATDQLPALLALALLETTVHRATWRELRKLAGPRFDAGTQLAQGDPSALAEACVANRESLLRWVDEFSESLDVLRATLADGQPELLAGRFEQAAQERAGWLRQREAGEWEEGLRSELPPKQSVLQPLLGGLMPRKRKPGRKS
jgi:prephenate dehydrogenase